MPIQLKVNGQTHTVNTPGDKPLLWVLREDLALTGTKYSCGIAQCGVCTVHLNGQPVRSCVIPLAAAADGEVTTIEGAEDSAASAVQQAWRELDVVQCGFCQPGQMMSASALLSANSKPSDADIDNAMQGNLCRCATYHRIRAAIHRAADILEA
jgi:isoquinoline 1-oxidoreductase alpha subunit